MKFLSLILFVLILNSPANAKLIEVEDAALLKNTLATADDKIRILLLVPLANPDYRTKKGPSKKGIDILEKALAELKKAKRKDVIGYLADLYDQDVRAELAKLPRFPTNGPQSFPFFAIFKNGGVQGRVYGYSESNADLLVAYVGLMDQFKGTPKNWTLAPSQIHLQYVYNRSYCTAEKFESETKLLKETAAKLGVKYDIVGANEKHPVFKTGDMAYAFSNPGYVLREDGCRVVSAYYEWLGVNSPTAVEIQADYGADRASGFSPSDFTAGTISQLVEKVKTGNY